MQSGLEEVDSPFEQSPARSSFSVSTVDDLDDGNWWDDSSFVLPLPTRTRRTHNSSNASSASDKTPLVPQSRDSGSSLLFGQQDLHWEKQQRSPTITENGRPTGLIGFFFGFLYEESCPTDDIGSAEAQVEIWNRLNWDLFLAYTLTTAATAVPITLIPAAAMNLSSDYTSAFASRATAFAVMGTACGKLLNGSAGDVFGARRVSCVYALLLSLSLLLLALSRNESCAVWACFAVQFCQSVQWPCIIVILAGHYNRQGINKGMYEGGIYVTSLASRLGSLLAIPLTSLLLRRTSWRVVAQCGALVSLTGAIVMFLFVSDSPMKRDDPQNPIKESVLQDFSRQCRSARSGFRIAVSLTNLIRSVFITNLVPALKAVLKSGTFWIVAIAHTGSSMVRTSELVLSTYFRDTSFGTLSEDRAGGLVVFLSFGTILGLAIGGSIFSRRNATQRKRMVVKLYVASIAAAYTLALLAVPRLRIWLGGSGLVLVFQVMATFVMGFGIAVQCYQIPGLVGATFGHNKGLYAAYTDGVAYGLSSGVWRIIGDAVQEGNPQGGGWAYGWAGVALMLVLCAVLMVEFMEHYFVRACKTSLKQGGGYETIIFV